jgi:hypothetical protein
MELASYHLSGAQNFKVILDFWKISGTMLKQLILHLACNSTEIQYGNHINIPNCKQILNYRG